jgi:hypothetical protein
MVLEAKYYKVLSSNKKRNETKQKQNEMQEGGLDFIHTELTFVVIVVAMIFFASSISLYSIFHPR